MKAQCLCGAVSLETAENRELHACHCGKCRVWGSGASFTLAAQSPEITGSEHIAHYQSSEWAQRCFCKHCGTHLFDNAGFETASQIFIDCKAPYYDLANDTPKLTEAEFLEMVGAAG